MDLTGSMFLLGSGSAKSDRAACQNDQGWLMACARAVEGTAPRNRRVKMAAVVCVSDPGIMDLGRQAKERGTLYGAQALKEQFTRPE